MKKGKAIRLSGRGRSRGKGGTRKGSALFPGFGDRGGVPLLPIEKRGSGIQELYQTNLSTKGPPPSVTRKGKKNYNYLCRGVRIMEENPSLQRRVLWTSNFSKGKKKPRLRGRRNRGGNLLVTESARR